jgi:hypothetical protein
MELGSMCPPEVQGEGMEGRQWVMRGCWTR